MTYYTMLHHVTSDYTSLHHITSHYIRFISQLLFIFYIFAYFYLILHVLLFPSRPLHSLPYARVFLSLPSLPPLPPRVPSAILGGVEEGARLIAAILFWSPVLWLRPAAVFFVCPTRTPGHTPPPFRPDTPGLGVQSCRRPPATLQSF